MEHNFELITKQRSTLLHHVKRLSKAIKLCHYLLTSPELGYKNVQFEYFYETNKSVDLYIHEIDLAIELDGPAHFFATMEEG